MKTIRILLILIIAVAGIALSLDSTTSLNIDETELNVGDPVLLILKTAKPAVWATTSFFGNSIRLEPDDDRLIALTAINRNQKPGRHSITVDIQFDDGSKAVEEFSFLVKPVDFPTQKLSVDPRFVTLSSEDLKWVAEDNAAAGEAYRKSAETRLWNEPFIQPASGRWSAQFGVRRMFNGEERSYHSGSDIAVPTGTSVFASNRGRVALIKDMFFGGKTVLIDHGQGVFTGYMHLSETSVNVGQTIERNQEIGKSGSTGRVTGPHLHWMLRIHGIKCNAAALLEMKYR